MLDTLAADALLTLANDALIGALMFDTEVESVEGVVEDSELTKLDGAMLDDGSTAAQRPASGWQPVPQAAPRPQKPSELQHAPKVEPRHVKPRVKPHVPSREMGSEVGDAVGEAVDEDSIVDEEVAVEDVDWPMGAAALQSPKSP
jgi:hypothetical protein